MSKPDKPLTPLQMLKTFRREYKAFDWGDPIYSTHQARPATIAEAIALMEKDIYHLQEAAEYHSHGLEKLVYHFQNPKMEAVK